MTMKVIRFFSFFDSLTYLILDIKGMNVPILYKHNVKPLINQHVHVLITIKLDIVETSF